eukprot:GFUD01037919.1.p1 GENE.GFUD01037919.1~~GFUD01037919.1.p1  ORF type:complete len:1219 (+),score=513.71 GFUD01037919.1:43-3699(+)
MSEKTGPYKSYRRDRQEKKKSVPDKQEGKDTTKMVEGKHENKEAESEPRKTEEPSEEQIDEGKLSESKDHVINIEERELEKENLARDSIENYIAESRAKMEWKENIRKANLEASANRSDDDKQFYKLDSSLKKNTAFVKKCKTFSDGQKASLTKEMGGLNLTKYIGEVASALVETKLKMSDITAMVDFCSALHQKYTEFSTFLMENWTKILSMKKDEKVSNPSKMRVDLRLYSELVSVGVFTLKSGLPLLGNVLTTLVTQDKESLTNSAIIISFCKHCGEDYAGLVPTTIAKLVSRFSLTLPIPTLLSPDKQRPVRNILTDYHTCLVASLLNVHKELALAERANRRQLMTRGEVSAERKEKAEKLSEEFAKLKGHAEQMAESMGEEMLEMPKLETEKDEEDEQELANDVAPDTLGQLWDDEDTKAFYENLPDLVAIIPSILYKDSKGEGEPVNKKDTEDLDNENEDEIQIDEEPVEEVNLEEDEDMAEAINMSTRMVLDAFLSQLPNCVNREMIDSAAAEFCMNHNTKSNRKRLVKALFSVQRTRTDLLSFYSRLVAALQPCMPDVPNQLAALLKQDFRWHVRKKDQINIESKLKVCRFIGELTKFSMFSKADVLFCVKQLLFDFSHHHIEMACTIFESCGAFLYRSPDSHRRTKIYLEQMLRRKAAMSLDSRYTTMIENAFYMVAPPDSQQEARRERPPLHQYIRKLVYADLNKTNTEKILRQIRKFNWDDPEVAAYVVKCLKNVWNLKYFNIRYVASLLAGLVQYHDWVGQEIIDSVLEDIRLGMEANNPKQNQRRTAMVKFLGEMYNYRLVESALIFKVLYSLITFGVIMDPETAWNSLDHPDQMVRLRLVCVLLDTCGQYFSSGTSKKKLDYYLLYFQRYYLFKKSCYPSDTSFPLGISNIVLETISIIRPKMKMLEDFETACKAVLKIEEEFVAILREKMPEFMQQQVVPQEGEAEGAGLGTISEGMEEEEELSQVSEGNSQSQPSISRSRSVSQAAMFETEGVEFEGEEWDRGEGEQEMLDSQDSENVVEVDEGDEDMMVPSIPVFEPCPEDDDFLAALDKMVNENISESKGLVRDKNSLSSMTAPVSSGRGKKNWEQLQEEQEDQEDNVQVVVMLRKGGKATTAKGISVSADSMLGEQFLAREEREQREKTRVKQLTLEISERQEEEELTEALQQLQRVSMVGPGGARRGFRPNKGAPDADLIFGNKKPQK